jgi:hypothetical protein
LLGDSDAVVPSSVSVVGSEVSVVRSVVETAGVVAVVGSVVVASVVAMVSSDGVIGGSSSSPQATSMIASEIKRTASMPLIARDFLVGFSIFDRRNAGVFLSFFI